MTTARTETSSSTRLVNLSELTPSWQWLKASFLEDIPDWHHVSSQGLATRLAIARSKQARWRAVNDARRRLTACAGTRILISHGPRPATYWGIFAGGTRIDAHDVMSFNFTEMPTGIGRRLMARALRGVSEFVVSSKWERAFYADYFDIPPSRIRFQHWGIQAPTPTDPAEVPLVAGAYICALGSQARDYAALIDAMRICPQHRLVIVATPESVRGIDMPFNVEFLTNIPLAQAMNILRHSQFTVLPMNSPTARCGHVTAVSAMHMGVPIVSTDCRGLDDYLQHGETALLAAQGDVAELASAINRLADDEATRQRLSIQGLSFARTKCTEEAVVESFRSSLTARAVLP